MERDNKCRVAELERENKQNKRNAAIRQQIYSVPIPPKGGAPISNRPGIGKR